MSERPATPGGSSPPRDRAPGSRNTPFVVASSIAHIRGAVDAGLMHATLRERRGKQVRLADGRTVTEFVNCSYLGLDLHPAAVAGGKRALDEWGVHFCCARSRFSIGPTAELEEGLSRLFRGRAITFPSVTSAHASVLPLLAAGVLLEERDRSRPVRLIFDRRAHASMQFLRPVLATEARVVAVAHNDLGALADQAREARGSGESPIYVADGVYSMGGLCPVRELLALSESLGLYLYLDDAHGTSVYGDRGEGWVLSQLGGPLPSRVFVNFSLAKGFGANGGGVVVPSAREEALVRMYGQSYAFSGPLDFSVVGAALAILALHEDGTVAAFQRTLREKVALFDTEAGRAEPFCPIRMVQAGTPERCIRLGEALLARGYFATTAFFPVVPCDHAQLRLVVTAAHGDEALRGVARALRAAVQEIPEPENHD